MFVFARIETLQHLVRRSYNTNQGFPYWGDPITNFHPLHQSLVSPQTFPENKRENNSLLLPPVLVNLLWKALLTMLNRSMISFFCSTVFCCVLFFPWKEKQSITLKVVRWKLGSQHILQITFPPYPATFTYKCNYSSLSILLTLKQ